MDRRAGDADDEAAARLPLADRGESTRSGSDLTFRHSGTRNRRYLRRILLVASSGALALPLPAPARRELAVVITDAGV
ncbi:hypothetical protein L9G15_23295, partial [Shewanella sp. A3A]|nr:hypothetical protein [Shewanella ferrihydritica]